MMTPVPKVRKVPLTVQDVAAASYDDMAGKLASAAVASLPDADMRTRCANGAAIARRASVGEHLNPVPLVDADCDCIEHQRWRYEHPRR